MKKVILFMAVLSLALSGGAVADIRDGLVGYWPMDGEIINNVVPDLSGSGHDGLLLGTATSVDAVVGQGLTFNGDWGNAVDCGTWNPSEITGQLSISIWARWNGQPGLWQGIMGKRDNWQSQGEQIEYCWFVEINAGAGTFGFISKDYSVDFGGISEGEWVHIAATWDGTTAVTYVNGVQVNSGAFQIGPKLDAHIWLAACNTGPANNFNGTIDEAAIWDRVLSADEVAALYNNGAGLPLTGIDWRPVLLSPPDKTTGVALTGTTLVWDVPPEQPGDPIDHYNVYLSTDRAEVSDPNGGTTSVAFLGSVSAAGPLQLDTGALVNDATYYWKVDSAIDDANTLSSSIWSFETVSMVPVIITQPEPVAVGPGGWPASFSIEASSPDGGALAYEWYKEGSGVLLGTDATLAIASVGAADEGRYYCVVSNSYGSVTSDSASLSVRIYDPAGAGLTDGLQAYYPLDGNFNDTTDGAHHGTLLSDPSTAPFVDGIIGEAAEFDGQSGTGVDTGTWNPSEETGELSVSCWARWRSDGASTWQGLVAKRDGWADGETYWHLECTPDSLYFERWGASGAWYGQGLGEGQWRHVCVTYDGTNATLYLDNTVVASGSNMVGFGKKPDAHVVFGCVDGGGGNPFPGALDEIAIWNRTLSPAEVDILYNNGNGTSLPSPAWWQPVGPTPDGSEWVDPTVPLTVSWQYGPYPPFTAEYRVYLTTDPEALADPNSDVSAYYKGTVPAGEPLELVIGAGDLDYNGTYYWRVDTHDGGTKVAGKVWTFDTIKTLPIITTQPTGALVEQGGTASLSISVSSDTPESYEWFIEGGGSAGTGNPLVITNVQPVNEGAYYCVVTNDAGSVTSQSAKVAIKKLVAHWTMDDVIDENNRQVTDVSGSGYHGVAVEGVSSTTGLIGGALSFNNGWVECGTFNPSDPGGQITVSFWANWRGSTGTWQAVMAKRDSWEEENFYWIVTCNETDGGRLGWGGALWPYFGEHFMTIGEWTHVTFTFDGTNADMYLNGNHVGGPLPYAFAGKPDAGIYLGTDRPWADYFNGALDDVRIYNYALDPIAASLLYTDVTGGTACPIPLTYDLNNDCRVDFADFAVLGESWMQCNLIPEDSCN